MNIDDEKKLEETKEETFKLEETNMENSKEEVENVSEVLKETVSESIIDAEEIEEEKVEDVSEILKETETVSEQTAEVEEIKEEKVEDVSKPKKETKEAVIENEKVEPKDEKRYKVAKQEPKQRRKVRTAIAACIIVALFVIIVMLSTVFALANINNKNIVTGVTIKGISITGLSKENAKLEIEKAMKTELENNINLKYKEYETSISPEQIKAKYNIDKAIEEAYNYGRSGNIVKNNYQILFAIIFGKKVDLDFSYSQEALTQMIEDLSKKLPGAMKETSYYIEGENLIITKGEAGIIAKKQEIKQLIVNAIINFDKEYIEIPIENAIPKEISIDKIYEEVYKEPKDAYYTENPFTIHPHEDGVNFAITLEEARKIVSENKKEYTIPLKFTTPNITTNQIGTEAFPDLLSNFSTNYDASNRNRSTNLELAAGKINGTVLLPGEEFSYNKVVGERTIAAGYKEAAIYSGGQVVDGLGGGICQISSTLYDAVVMANLEITDRSNHQFLTSYVGAGKDATVVYGVIDFKFKNTRKYPVKIVCNVSGGVAEMKVFGVKEDVEYDIKIETEILSSIPYSTKYVEDSTLSAGIEKVKQYGHSGCKSIAYKVCRINGEVVSKTILSQDTYSSLTKIIRRGTKNATPVQETTPKTPSTTVTNVTNTNVNKNTTTNTNTSTNTASNTAN